MHHYTWNSLLSFYWRHFALHFPQHCIPKGRAESMVWFVTSMLQNQDHTSGGWRLLEMRRLSCIPHWDFCPIDWTNRNGGSITTPHNVNPSLQNRSGSAVHMLCSDVEAAKDYRANIACTYLCRRLDKFFSSFFNSNLCTRVHSRLCIFYFCNFCVLHRLISLACRSHLWLGAHFWAACNPLIFDRVQKLCLATFAGIVPS